MCLGYFVFKGDGAGEGGIGPDYIRSGFSIRGVFKRHVCGWDHSEAG